MAGPIDVRVGVFGPEGPTVQVFSEDASEYFGGGEIQYEDTPSGSGAATLQLGLTNEEMVGLGIFQAMNLIEISTGDDTLQRSVALTTSGTVKLYCSSTIPYDTVTYGEDTPQVYLFDGTNFTPRIPVQSVGTDGFGPYIVVAMPPQGFIPATTAGSVLGRRRYCGRIIRRSRPNQKNPQTTLSCVGLIGTFDGAVGTFAYTNYDVGQAIYEAIAQFQARWAFLTISAGNFPTVGTPYTGNGQSVQLSRIVADALSSIASGDLWVVRVGHDRTPRLFKLYDNASNTYTYNTTLQQGVTNFEVVSAEVDDDASQFYNAVEVIGGDDPTTKMPVAAIVTDNSSITEFFQVDAPPVTNTKLPSYNACASYATSLLNQSSQPRTNNQLRVYTRNDDSVPIALCPRGLQGGDPLRGFDNVIVQGFAETGSVINACPDSEIQYPGPALSTVTPSITGGGSPQTVNVDNTEFLTPGAVVNIGVGSDQEAVTIISLPGVNQIRAVFANSHAAGAAIWSSGASGLWSQAYSPGSPLGYSFAGGPGGSPAFTLSEAQTNQSGMKSRPFTVSHGQVGGASAYIDARGITSGSLQLSLASAENTSTVYGNVSQPAGSHGTVSFANIRIPLGETFCVLVLHANTGAGFTGVCYFAHAQAQRCGTTVDPYVVNYATLDQFGLVASAQTTIQPARDSWQDSQFSAIEPDWRATIGERANAMSTAMRHNLNPGVGLDQYFISIGAWNPKLTSTVGSITGSSSPQTIQVTSSNALQVGGTYAVDQNANLELVKITAIPDSTHITGKFLNNHSGGVPIWMGQSGEPSPQWTGSSFIVSVDQFEAVFGIGTGPVMVGGNTFTCAASATNWVWLNADGSWNVQGTPTPTIPDAILFAIFQTDASGIIGAVLKATLGYLGLPGSYNIGSRSYVPTFTSYSVTEAVAGALVSQVAVSFEITNQPRDGSLAHVNCWYRQTGQPDWLLLATSPVCNNTGAPAESGSLPGTGLYNFVFPDAANGTSYDFGFTCVDTEDGETTLAGTTPGSQGFIGSITTSDITNAVNMVTDSRWARAVYKNVGGGVYKAGSCPNWDFWLIDVTHCYLLKGAAPDGSNAFCLDAALSGMAARHGRSMPSVAVTPGQVWIAQAYIDGTTATNNNMRVEILDQTGLSGTGHFGPVLISAFQTAGQKGTVYTAALTIPGGVTQIGLNLNFNGVTVSAASHVSFSQPQLVESAIHVPYMPTDGGAGGQQGYTSDDITISPSQPLGPYVLSGCLSSVPGGGGSLTAVNPGGNIVVAGVPIIVPAQSITYPASSTSYDFVDASAVITTQSSSSPPTVQHVLLQTVVTAAVITGITDDRNIPSGLSVVTWDAPSQTLKLMPSAVGHIGHGTSFPLSPVDGQPYRRDDLGITYLYELGVGWLPLMPVGIDVTDALPAGISTDQTIFSGPCTLVGGLVSTAPPSTELVFRDGATGNIIGIVPANSPLGWEPPSLWNMPAATSIVAKANGSDTPGFTVNFSQGSPIPAGTLTQEIAAGTTGNTTISPAQTLVSLLVNSLGSVDMPITDGPGGTLIGFIKAGTPPGTPKQLNMNVANSIYVAGNAGNPDVTINYVT